MDRLGLKAGMMALANLLTTSTLDFTQPRATFSAELCGVVEGMLSPRAGERPLLRTLLASPLVQTGVRLPSLALAPATAPGSTTAPGSAPKEAGVAAAVGAAGTIPFAAPLPADPAAAKPAPAKPAPAKPAPAKPAPAKPAPAKPAPAKPAPAKPAPATPPTTRASRPATQPSPAQPSRAQPPPAQIPPAQIPPRGGPAPADGLTKAAFGADTHVAAAAVQRSFRGRRLRRAQPGARRHSIERLSQEEVRASAMAKIEGLLGEVREGRAALDCKR